jgi:hypothetical protein
MRTIDQMIQSEVLVCLSSLVSTLAEGYGTIAGARNPLAELSEQAMEIASPVPDYAEAAIQNVHEWDWERCQDVGYATHGPAPEDMPVEKMRADILASVEDWAAFCDEHNIEPYDREVFEHWAVTDWLADKLIAAGEKVDKDFAGMCVWARTTTGQGIAQDYVVQCIYRDTMEA